RILASAFKAAAAEELADDDRLSRLQGSLSQVRAGARRRSGDGETQLTAGRKVDCRGRRSLACWWFCDAGGWCSGRRLLFGPVALALRAPNAACKVPRQQVPSPWQRCQSGG